MFLERVEGVPLWQAGAVESWEGAARWLGGMHAAFGLGPGFRDDSGMSHLPRHDARFFATWAIRAAEFVRLRFGTGSPRTRRRFERIVADYDAVVRRLVRMPVTLVHGEFYPSNILLRPDGSICPVDWELAAIGPGLLDVAALVSGEWTAAQRARMANAYRRALESAGRTPGPVDAMSADIDCCRLHLAMQWLGWAADWNPPGGHARDWLREALRLAERLGIG
ncbi:MAG: aminoglycoside phosphotransferase family protein [Verrucomicrobia bacterium]|nr:MAG: aminoglycoside phosphotransferase family protein [Verrucomicrobiota bacterium]